MKQIITKVPVTCTHTKVSPGHRPRSRNLNLTNSSCLPMPRQLQICERHSDSFLVERNQRGLTRAKVERCLPSHLNLSAYKTEFNLLNSNWKSECVIKIQFVKYRSTCNWTIESQSKRASTSFNKVARCSAQDVCNTCHERDQPTVRDPNVRQAQWRHVQEKRCGNDKSFTTSTDDSLLL